MARGPYPALQRLVCGPPQPSDFIAIFLVWFLVTTVYEEQLETKF